MDGFTIRQTDTFATWLATLRDHRARARITQRLDRLVLGLFGDCKIVGEGVKELRIDYGPGYRVYFVRHGAAVVILLAGGDKSSQGKDIQLAIELARQLPEP